MEAIIEVLKSEVEQIGEAQMEAFNGSMADVQEYLELFKLFMIIQLAVSGLIVLLLIGSTIFIVVRKK